MTKTRGSYALWGLLLMVLIAAIGTLLLPDAVKASVPPSVQAQMPVAPRTSPTPSVVVWGRARADDKKKMLRANTVRAHLSARARGSNERASLNIAMRAATKPGGVRTKRWVLYGRSKTLGRTRAPIARGVTTVRTLSVTPGWVEIIRASERWARYKEVCRSAHTYNSARGIYCKVKHKGTLRVRQTTRIVNFAQPRILRVEDLGAMRPECTVGEETKEVDENDPNVQLTYRCEDHVSRGINQFNQAVRRYRLQVKIPTASGGERTITPIVAVEGHGQRAPGWVQVKREVATFPVAAVTRIVGSSEGGHPDDVATQSYYIEGTVTNTSWKSYQLIVKVASTGAEEEPPSGVVGIGPYETVPWIIIDWERPSHGTPLPVVTVEQDPSRR